VGKEVVVNKVYVIKEIEINTIDKIK